MKPKGLGWRLSALALVTVLGILWFVPNFVDTSKVWWPVKDRMTLGLDIQGGLHLVLRADIPGALKQEATRIAAGLPEELKKSNISFISVKQGDPLRGEIHVATANEADAEAVKKKILDSYGPQMFNVSASSSGAEVEYNELHVREFAKGTVERAIETIRNRIDEFGVAEPSITAQGDDRILVQLPGIQDSASAKELINKTARLDFYILNPDYDPQSDKGQAGFAKLQTLIEQAEKDGGFKLGPDLKYTAYVEKLNAALKGKIPEGSIVYFEKPDQAETMEAGRIPYLLMLSETVPGDLLMDAYVSTGETGAPVVGFRLDAQGGRAMGEMTEKHKGERMAIVLDRVVKTAPTIQSKITTNGQITLGRSGGYEQTLKEAKNISITLKSGALPAALEQLEERTVGATVGADAIDKGKMGALVGIVMVLVFNLIYYRGFGLLSSLMLLLNLVVTMAALSAIGATLTLPGVAGLALGIGMAVDASVIIYERIKDELRLGKSVAMASQLGFDKAFSAIFDSNITTIATCVVMIYYGSGPIRGFGVTLMAGLFVTLFAMVFALRALVELVTGKWGINLSIGGGIKH